jgi:hypothetical protein
MLAIRGVDEQEHVPDECGRFELPDKSTSSGETLHSGKRYRFSEAEKPIVPLCAVSDRKTPG